MRRACSQSLSMEPHVHGSISEETGREETYVSTNRKLACLVPIRYGVRRPIDIRALTRCHSSRQQSTHSCHCTFEARASLHKAFAARHGSEIAYQSQSKKGDQELIEHEFDSSTTICGHTVNTTLLSMLLS